MFLKRATYRVNVRREVRLIDVFLVFVIVKPVPRDVGGHETLAALLVLEFVEGEFEVRGGYQPD